VCERKEIGGVVSLVRKREAQSRKRGCTKLAAASSPGRTSNRSDGRHRALDLPCLLRQTGPSGGRRGAGAGRRRLRFVRMHVHGEMVTGPGERPAGAVSLFGLAWLGLLGIYLFPSRQD
jgi:hypothetical protein